MRPQKAYFLLPNTEIPPNTLIHLGQIIPSLREPHRCIGELLPSHLPKHSPRHLPNHYTSTKTNVTLTLSTSHSTHLSLLAHFLSQLGSPLSGGIGFNRGKTTSTTWNVDCLETVGFEPDATFVERVVHREEVRRELQKGATTAVYMITGIKIAYGASYTRSSVRTSSMESDISVDTTGLTGVPLAAGPEIAFQADRLEKETCGQCSDFVFAIRVRKIRLSFLRKKTVVRDVYGGELFSYGSSVDGGGDRGFGFGFGESEEEEEEDVEVDLKRLEMEPWDLGTTFTPRGFERERVVDEEGEECVAFC